MPIMSVVAGFVVAAASRPAWFVVAGSSRPAGTESGPTEEQPGADTPRYASPNATGGVEATVSRRTIAAGELSRAIIDPGEARQELGAKRFLLDEPLPLSGHDLGGRPLGELGPGQLALEEFDALGGTLDLLLEALALGGEVDDARPLDGEPRAGDDRQRP